MFSVKNLQLGRGITTSTAQGTGTSVIHTYIDLNTTVANIKLAFPPFLDQGADQDFILLTDYMFVTGSDTAIMARILSLDPFVVDVDLFSGAAGLSIAAPIPPVDANGAKITAGVLQLEFANQLFPGIVSVGAQDFAGEKTFHADVNVVEPATGVDIIKTMGDLAVNLRTNDATAMLQAGFIDEGLSNKFFGIRYQRNGFIHANPELYLFGGTHAGIVLDDTTGEVFIGDKTITDAVDASAGNPLTLGANNALSVNVDTNLIVNSTKELQTNQIDSATAAPLVLGATNTTFAVMNKGVQFLTSGGTPATLNDYEEYDHVTTFTNSAETTGNVTLSFIRTGNAVTVTLKTPTTTPGQATPGANFGANTLLPTRFRPAVSTTGFWRISNNGIFSAGAIVIGNGGGIDIYNNADFTTLYTAAVPNGFDSSSFAYSLI